MSICNLSVYELIKGYNEKRFSCLEVTKEYAENIKNNKINAIIFDNTKHAISKAKRIDKENAFYKSALSGIPFVLKDNIITKNIPTTCASEVLRGFVPPYDSSVNTKLKNAGAILLGKANLDDFGMGTFGVSSCFGKTLNPLNYEFCAGGSSSGSAACVASGLSPFSIGTDTGGSIRLPASFCGVFGFKPSYGAISRYGLISHASSLDTIGIISKTSLDASLIFTEIFGKDKKDLTSKSFKFDFEKDKNHLKGLKIAIPKNIESDKDIDSEILNCFLNAVDMFEKNGAIIKSVPMPFFEKSLQIYNVISCAEAFSNLARYDGIRYGYAPNKSKDISEFYNKARSVFGNEVKMRILFGEYVLTHIGGEIYAKSVFERQKAQLECDCIYNDFDLILTPSTTKCVPKLTEAKFGYEKTDSNTYDKYLCFANLCSLPSANVPFCFDKNKMPVSILLTGAKFRDDLVLGASHTFEEIRGAI